MNSLPAPHPETGASGANRLAVDLPSSHRARRCVLRVQAEFIINGGPRSLRGTAFHLGNGVCATAGHNFIQHEQSAVFESVSTSLIYENAKYPIEKVFLYDPFKTARIDSCDLALFTLDAPAIVGRYEIEPARAIDRDAEVFVLGYPAEGLTPADLDLHAYRGLANVDGAFLRYSAHAVRGMSGGPCLVGSKVRGVHIGRDQQGMRAVGFNDSLVGFARNLIQSRAAQASAGAPAAVAT